MPQPYAMIEVGTIVNVCTWDGATEFNPGPGIELTPLADLPPGAWIGWTRADDGTWNAPAQPADGA